jgi:hypothetical protein
MYVLRSWPYLSTAKKPEKVNWSGIPAARVRALVVTSSVLVIQPSYKVALDFIVDTVQGV